ncbi:putative MFS transporter [Massariosphaeria phaeospora]|uniref:Putative MFS transporter n=1 Tax=Massariosphaeria phaeospora TaxID=100035 RepID=A0A7C8HZR8_9PLEO|nr:putative MFS transporter [Massariosphaeria phaeospora]
MSQDTVTNDGNADPLDTIEEHEYPGGLRLAAIVAALVLSIFLASLDTTIITTAIPSITNEFHSLEDVGWYGSAMFFPLAATQSVWGKAYKYFPVKPVFLVSILIFEVGSLICALAQNSNAFIAGRAITGAGCAGTFSGCFIIISLSSRPRLRPAMTSSLSATFAVAAVVGPLIGGAFTQSVTWRWCFYINLPCGSIAAVAMLFAFQAPKAASPTPATTKEKFLQMDIPGAILICAAIVCFTLALRWAGVDKSWKDPNVVGTLVATPVFLILFGMDQWYQGDRALIVPVFLTNRVLIVGAVFEFFIAGCFNLALFYLPIYFQAVRGVSAISSGVRLIPVILGLTISQIAVGVIITVTGIHNPFLILGPAIAAVGSGLVMLLDERSDPGRWIGFQIVLGVGVGFCLTIPLMLSQVVVKTKDVSTATSIIIFSQSMGSAFLLPTAQAVFQNQLTEALRRFVPEINPLVVLSVGANSEAISSLPRASLRGIVQSYDNALRYTFAIGIPFAGVALLVSFFMPWFRYHNAPTDSTVETALGQSQEVDGAEDEKNEESKMTGRRSEISSTVEHI